MLKLLLLISVVAQAENIRSFKNCDRVIKKCKYKICYDYDLKLARKVSYTLYGSKVNFKNIRKRPDFHADYSLPYKYRRKHSDYYRTGYDRGHLAPDASFDYDQDVLSTAYAMTNIVPQKHGVNVGCWLKAEFAERDFATKYKRVFVLNVVNFSDNPKRLGRKSLPIPDSFDKLIYKNRRLLKRFHCSNK